MGGGVARVAARLRTEQPHLTHAQGVHPAGQAVQDVGVPGVAHGDAFVGADVHLVVGAEQAEGVAMAVPVVGRGDDLLDELVLLAGCQCVATHPRRTGPHEAELDAAVGDPPLVEVVDDVPGVGEVGAGVLGVEAGLAGVDGVVVVPIEGIGVGVVIGGLPVDHVHPDAEGLHASLVDQQVEDWFELAVVPRVGVDVGAQRRDGLELLTAVDRDLDIGCMGRRQAYERQQHDCHPGNDRDNPLVNGS